MKRFLMAASLLLAGVMPAVSCGGSGIEKWEKQPGGEVKKDSVKVATAEDYAAEAKVLFDRIEMYYGISSGDFSGLYKEEYPGEGNASYLWPYDGLMSGIAGLNRLGYDVGYAVKIGNYERYWRSSGVEAVGGYGSGTDGTSGRDDRFYDDNSIVGLNLVEAYSQTGDETYLDRALKIVPFLKSGKDEVFGGGVWWNESYRNVSGVEDSNKPTCANGFATWFLMRLYEVCPASDKAEVLDLAKELYAWVRDNLRDDDGCYFNSKGADGSINRTKWTYNTGAMIASGVRLYKATGDIQYINDAKASADGSFAYFVKPRNGLTRSYPTNDPWFTVKLVKSYMELEPYSSNCKEYISAFITFMDYALEHGRMSNGLFYEDWTGVTPRPDRDKSLLMQDAALESLTVIALYLKNNSE